MAKKKDTAMAIVRDLAKIRVASCDEEEPDIFDADQEKASAIVVRAKALLKQAKKGGDRPTPPKKKKC